MIKRITSLVGTFFLFVTCIFAQTATELNRTYGEPVSSFSVSEHIWMSPEYATDGQVCQARLYPKKFAADASYLTNLLQSKELKQVLDRLVPLGSRGAKKTPFGQTATGGGAAWTTYAYDNVTFVFISSFHVDTSNSMLKPYVFSEGVVASSSNGSTATREPFTDAEIVNIKWTNRSCVVR